jgi:hypothetical protein
VLVQCAIVGLRDSCSLVGGRYSQSTIQMVDSDVLSLYTGAKMVSVGSMEWWPVQWLAAGLEILDNGSGRPESIYSITVAFSFSLVYGGSLG